MKKLNLILILLSTALVSLPSYADWSEGYIYFEDRGNELDVVVHYIDTDRIREVNGQVYYWQLQDHSAVTYIETVSGAMSYVAYYKGDCDLMRSQRLSIRSYLGRMGEGDFTENNIPRPWRFHYPDSVGETLLKFVCDFIK